MKRCICTAFLLSKDLPKRYNSLIVIYYRMCNIEIGGSRMGVQFLDFRSDTVTIPTLEMREAMFKAEVGDDVYGEDPTIIELERQAAKKLGKEASLFCTSGTQGNLIAVLTHTRRGDEVLLEAESHIYYYEVGGISALGGVIPRPIVGHAGVISPEVLRAAIRPADIHYPNPSLFCLENSHNRGGGAL